MNFNGFAVLETTVSTSPPVTLAVAGGNMESVLRAVEIAITKGYVSHAYVTGNCDQINRHLNPACRSSITVVEAVNAAECADRSVQLIRLGKADILMKGHIDSRSFLQAVVNRTDGIRKSPVLSNITFAQMPSYPKWIAASDNGITPNPTFSQKVQIVLNTRSIFAGLGNQDVKVAAIAASETVNERIPSTTDAAALAAESHRGLMPGFTVEGPLAYDVAVSVAAADAKGLRTSTVAGNADLLIFSNIEAANSVVKSWKYHGQAQTGSIVLGASVPVIMNSRSDEVDRRLNALLLAIVESMASH